MLKAWTLMGKKVFFRTGNELKNLKFQRSIYVTKKIKKGEVFSSENIKRIRPGFSLPANKWILYWVESPKKIILLGHEYI